VKEIAKSEKPPRYSIYEKRHIIRQHRENKVPLAVLSRRYSISTFCLYKWNKMIDLNKDPDVPHGKLEELLAELEQLKSQNQLLKKSVEDLTLEKTCNRLVIDELKKTFQAKSSSGLQKRSSKKKRSK
jgi:hypothetical protein